jgi:opacity protein-like surface antigen
MENMFMKMIAKLLTLLMITFAIPVFAQEAPNAFRPVEIEWNLLSYSRQGSINLYGGDLSFTGYPTKRFGITADVAVHSGTAGGLDVDTITYRFGPKFRTPLGKRWTHFGEFLVGGSRLTGSTTALSGGATTTSSASTSGFALAFGGGLDVAIRPWIAVRVVQFDYSYLRFSEIDTSSNGFRVGGGLVFRMGPH